MISSNLKFTGSLLLIMSLVFVSHVFIQHQNKMDYLSNSILVCYLFNVFLTALFFGLLTFFKKRKSEQLGFIFLYSSLFKLIAFFIVISPLLKTDAGFSKAAILSFFIPYATSLSIEVYYLTRLLRD